LFTLANAGIPIQRVFLLQAYRSSITLGIIAAYGLGKPVGILAGSWVVTRWAGWPSPAAARSRASVHCKPAHGHAGL